MTEYSVVQYCTGHSWFGRQHFYHGLAKAWARQRPHLFVSRPILWPGGKKGDPSGRWIPGGYLHQPQPWLWVLEPVTTRGMRFSGVRGLKDILTARATVAAITEIGFDPHRMLIWSYYPDALRIFSRLPQACSVYWTGDEVLDPKEPELLRRVDHVFALSPDAAAQKRLMVEEKVSAMPMAVDPEPFVVARVAGNRPSDVQGLRPPLIGYGGAFSERIDWRILHEIADRTTGTLVLVGPIVDGEAARLVKGLTDKPSVVWLGHRGADEAPHFLAAFDVALIPYKRNHFNNGSNPVKFYEYLAAGLPIVSVKLPALSEFDDVALFVDDPSEFAEAAEAVAAQQPDSAAVERRQRVAREHSYERLIAIIEDRISCGQCFAD